MHIVLFDIDGTLLHSGGAGKAALETAFQEIFDISLEASVPYSGRTDKAIVRDLFTLHDIPATPANWQRLVAGYLARLPSCLRRHQGAVLPGIAALLETLAGMDHVAVGLLTGNIREGAKVKLGHFELHRHFAFGGFGDDHFERDDVAREALAVIHERFAGHATPDRIWVIGDTPLDIQCARAIGAKGVAVATGLHTAEQLAETNPDMLFTDLSDASSLVELWRSK